MSAFIPEDKIAEIKSVADIVEIIAEAVVLKKAGKNYLGLCPFHSEKTPSFSVSPDKQIFHCFGCGVGGNAFTFLMKHQGATFPEAVRQLARRYGVDLPERKMTPQQRRQASLREELFALNREVMLFYQRCLEDPRIGKTASAYLKRRGFDAASLERFCIGYAPAGWDTLLRFYRKKRVPEEIAQKSGLIVPRKQGNGYYDRFRDRVMFPIFDISNRVIGFGGRALDDGLPKYLNSPETTIYNKRRSLYGVNWSRQAARELGAVYIVEGYLDMLSLHANGVQNVVATLGTALTMEQVRALKGLVGSGTIILVFDSDAAGIKAAHRSLELFWQVHTNFRKDDVFTEGGADTRILVLPDNHDPDSYIREHGADAFLSLAEAAPGIIPFLLESAIGRYGTGTEGKIRVLAALAGPLAAVNDPVARSVYTKMLAERLDIDERAVVEKARLAAADTGAPEGKRTDSAEMTGDTGTDRVERQLVTMMIQFPEILDDVRRRRIVERFSDTRLQSAGMAILAADGAVPLDVAAVIGHIDDPETQALVSRLAMADEKWSREGCRRLMEQFENTYSRSHDQLVRQIQAAEADNDHDTLQRLLEEKLRRARGTHSRPPQGRTDTTERA